MSTLREYHCDVVAYVDVDTPLGDIFAALPEEKQSEVVKATLRDLLYFANGDGESYRAVLAGDDPGFPSHDTADEAVSA